MFTLLLTAFLPIAGVKFAWVTWHWMAGLVLTASILFHIVHATVWLDFWSIWVGPKDSAGAQSRDPARARPRCPRAEVRASIRSATASTTWPSSSPALSVVATGLFMMVRVRTPFFTRNPYLLGDATWGFIYVLHGLAGVALVGLVIAHVYFAVRPEKWWITKSMILGWITRRQYLEHHDPHRWVVEGAPKPER